MLLIILLSFCLFQVIAIYNCLYNNYFYQTESLCPLKYLACLKSIALPYIHMLASCNRSGTHNQRLTKGQRDFYKIHWLILFDLGLLPSLQQQIAHKLFSYAPQIIPADEHEKVLLKTIFSDVLSLNFSIT